MFKLLQWSLKCLFNVFRVASGELKWSWRTLREVISLSLCVCTLLLDPHFCSDMAPTGSGNNNNILWTFNTIHIAYVVSIVVEPYYYVFKH